MKKYALVFMTFLFGCASSVGEPPFEINNKQFGDAEDILAAFDENGNVQLYDEEPLKLEVHQSYIYKQERNDNSL